MSTGAIEGHDLPRPWAVPGGASLNRTTRPLVRDGVAAALAATENIQLRIPSWQRLIAAAQTDAQAAGPDWGKICGQFKAQRDHPADLVEGVRSRDNGSRSARPPVPVELSFDSLLGIHGHLLLSRLTEAQSWWDSALEAACSLAVPAPAAPAPPSAPATPATQAAADAPAQQEMPAQQEVPAEQKAAGPPQGVDPASHPEPAKPDPASGFLSDLDRLGTALSGAMQHSLFLTFLSCVRDCGVGESHTIDDHCDGWGLTSDQVSTVWLWLTHDPLSFGGEKLPIALDKTNRLAYRKAAGFWTRALYATAAFWGGVFVYGLITGLFAILHSAGIWSYPDNRWWRLLVLVLFVLMGAWAHIGAKAINVNYDNPISVYDAGTKFDWLALRWLGVLQMYIPVGVVTAALWGAGNFPSSFQKLGTAILAGYSADSFVSAAVSKAPASATTPPQPAVSAGAQSVAS
jgi:hypothetical protein